jgi:hypothetical protein
MPIDLAALKAEIQGDPKGLDYGPHAVAQDDGAVADLLNSTTGPGAATIALSFVSRDDFLKAILPAFLVLPTLATPDGWPETIQAKWDRILNMINAGAGVTINAPVQVLLAQAVTDGVLTQEQADAVWHRTGSRAEVLGGPGTVVTPDQVSVALRGNV